jgi:hypothetical protein
MLLMHWADPGRMVLPLTYPWHVHGGSVLQALGHVWFIFAWAVAVTALFGFIAIRTGVPRADTPGRLFSKGVWVSVNAGFFEEIIYRWFIFFSALVMVAFFNTITFHLVHIINEYLLLPVANFATFGALHAQLYGSYGWMFGAAMVVASISFRDAHEGVLRAINAWFMGMVFFWVLFHYGIVAAIVAHILYDVCTDLVAAICAHFQPEPAGLFDGLAAALLGGMLRP